MKEYSCLELYQTNLMKFSYILGGKKCFKYKLNIYVNIYFMDLKIIDIFNLVLPKKIIMIPPLNIINGPNMHIFFTKLSKYFIT